MAVASAHQQDPTRDSQDKDGEGEERAEPARLGFCGQPHRHSQGGLALEPLETLVDGVERIQPAQLIRRSRPIELREAFHQVPAPRSPAAHEADGNSP